MEENNIYDVSLSFAGENREYVEKVAYFLKKYGKNVFYDDFEKASLWGKNLYDHLHDIYKNKSLYIIMFVSEHYKNKEWTIHERKASQERAFIQPTEYILPVRFDRTEIPGLNSTIGYLDANQFSPEEIAQIFIQKTDGKIFSPEESVPVNEESENFPAKYKNSVYLWHTSSNLKVDSDLIKRCQVQVIVDTDNTTVLNLIDNVTYHLHPTFLDHVKIINTKENRFLLKFKAWGSFLLKAEVQLIGYEKPLVLYRYINLHSF